MIRFLVMDVDGTLTDSKVYMGNDGEMCKAFDIKDGYAIKCELPTVDIIPVIITARTSAIVANRCAELNIVECHQGVSKKYEKLLAILEKYSERDSTNYNLSNVAYIGDDILDLQCMVPVKVDGGFVGCPNNAVNEVKNSSDFVSKFNGGDGAVREFVEWIISQEQQQTCSDISTRKNVDKYVDFILSMDKTHLNVGHYEVDEYFFYNVQEYKPFDKGESCYESHRKYIDIQYLLSGCEKMLVTDINNLTPCDEYDGMKDVIHYNDNRNQSYTLLQKGSCIVLYPKDAHKPEKFGTGNTIRKIVGKVKIN